MTTYYQDAKVRVTHDFLELGDRRIRIADLTYVWHQRGRPTPRTASRFAGRYGLIALLTLPVLVVSGVVAYFLFGGFGPVVATAVAVALAALALAVLAVLLSPLLEFPFMALERSYDRGLEVREIWGQWRGQELVLLRTTDAARFGKIYRAIERAIERTDY